MVTDAGRRGVGPHSFRLAIRLDNDGVRLRRTSDGVQREHLAAVVFVPLLGGLA